MGWKEFVEKVTGESAGSGRQNSVARRRTGLFKTKDLLDADDRGGGLFDITTEDVDVDYRGIPLEGVSTRKGTERLGLSQLKDTGSLSSEQLQILDRNAAYKEARKGLLSRGITGKSTIGSR